MNTAPVFLIDGSRASIADLHRVATGSTKVVLSTEPRFVGRLVASRETLEKALAAGRRVYGVTSGFGDSAESFVSEERRRDLARNLARYHRIGVGPKFDRAEIRSILFSRLVCLARGGSAVRVAVLDQLVAFLNLDLLPQVPCQGSVGASGDLTPLAYVASALMGEGDVIWQGRTLDAASALRESALLPLDLDARETLGLMNGTSAMTGLGALAVERSRRLIRWAIALGGLACEALSGDPQHFSPKLVGAKGHSGSNLVSTLLAEDLAGHSIEPERLQERYSVRCVPQVLGVAVDVLADAERYVETELNSINDNPLFDAESGEILHGGNFYGGHVCHAMDSLRAQLANVADILDRQLALLCSTHTNAGLPSNLVADGESHPERHGFKAAQITASALAVEAIKASFPVSVLSRSTENHNQDKVSLGTIAARDTLKVLEWVENLAAIHTLALLQALELRRRTRYSHRAQAMLEAVRPNSPTLGEDRALDRDVHVVLELYRAGALPLGELRSPG